MLRPLCGSTNVSTVSLHSSEVERNGKYTSPGSLKVFISYKDLQYLFYYQIWLIVNIYTIAYITTTLHWTSILTGPLHHTPHFSVTVLLQYLGNIKQPHKNLQFGLTETVRNVENVLDNILIFKFLFGEKSCKKRRFNWFWVIMVHLFWGWPCLCLEAMVECVTIRKRAPERTRSLPTKINTKLNRNRVYAINQCDNTCVFHLQTLTIMNIWQNLEVSFG